MILCVDIGNTSIKIAVVANRGVVDLAHVRSDASHAAIAKALLGVMNADVDSAAIASVDPSVTDKVRDAIRRVLGIQPLIVTSRVKMPITIGTRRPARVGVDRLCAACGALTDRRRNAIVVDIGSAITVDLVLDRRFVGGLIMPGPQMMLSAMHHFTAQLPDLELTNDPGDRFDDTAPAMRAGALVGSAGAIQSAVDVLKRRSKRSGIPVFVTGGHAARLRKKLPSGWKYLPDLTLIGLGDIARLNSSAR